MMERPDRPTLVQYCCIAYLYSLAFLEKLVYVVLDDLGKLQERPFPAYRKLDGCSWEHLWPASCSLCCNLCTLSTISQAYLFAV